MKLQEQDPSTKVFRARESPLSEVGGEQFQYVFSLCPAVFCFTMLYSALKDYEREGRPYFGIRLIQTAFAQFHVALFIWICIFLSSLCVYFVFLRWARLRDQILRKQLFDTVFIFLYLLYVIGLQYSAAKMIFSHGLGEASSLAVIMETVRTLMKSYSFIRTNAPRHLGSGSGPNLSFARYLYFLFAPTLLYRDVYPRSKRIRWGFFGARIAEMAMILLFSSVLLENTYMHQLQDYGLKRYTFLGICTIILQYYCLGQVISMMICYFWFHNYMNMAAEILKFSDRTFYEDWWTATTLDEFLKKWNVFVYEWLYVFVYKDCHEHLIPGRKRLAKFLTLLLSGIYHDLVVCVSFRLFLPIFTLAFVSLIFFRQLSSKKFLVGFTGIQVSGILTIYMMEYYARQNCPMAYEGVLDVVKPRFLYCEM